MTTGAVARRLTQFSTGGGCACKIPQSLLGEVLASVNGRRTVGADPRLLIGLDPPDDAAVYAVDGERAWIVTTDFLTPVVDDPYDWGRIAAANALSDVYAMGGRPLLALNILAWPDQSDELSSNALGDVLTGGAETVTAAGAVLVGGHSIVDPIPKYGLVAVGEVGRDAIITKGGGRAGDQLVLTKPIGIGIVSTAVKRGQAGADVVAAAVASATRLNADAMRAAATVGVRGGTDVTGYGVVGHLHEMAVAAGVGARLFTDRVPLLPGVKELIVAGCAPDGTRRTLVNARSRGWFAADGVTEDYQLLLADAQTSGGLLLAVPPGRVRDLLDALHKGGDPAASVIGELIAHPRPGTILAVPVP